MRDETKCLHSGYTPENGGPRVMPIYQSTTFRFNSTDEIAAVFDDPTKAHIYSRFTNPTVDAVEKKIADLEHGVAAMCTSSGQMASLMSILNLCQAGDSFVSASAIYGGTVNLFAYTLKKLGIECIFVDVDADEDEIQAKIKPNTKAIFGETLTNPSLQIFDIEKFAHVAHKNGLPLIVDNTFATPILCKPIDFGADVVIHSTSKYMDGHALQVGGVIVDGGKFDYTNGKFSEFCEPDESYHGTIYTRDYAFAPYIIKARMQLMRDFGAYPSGHSGFLLNLGLETLAVRMERYCKNAITVAKYATVQLEGSRSVERLIEYYNLDVIISVGYRVKSKRGIAFRKWATTVLNDYLLRGYAENKRRLEAQGKTIELQSRIIAHMAEVDEKERNVVYLSRQVITNGALVAITLMIAESRPEEKDVMITLVMSLLSKS